MAEVKFVLTGDIATGKTSIIRRFAEGVYEAEAPPTMCDSMERTISLGGRDFVLQIWDTAGQERFRTVTSSFYKGARVVAFVFDVAEEATFNNLTHWNTEVDRCAGESTVKVLIGNKIDLEPRAVSYEQASSYAAELGIAYHEVSAKDGTNIDQCFTEMLKEVADSIPPPKPVNTVRPGRGPNKDKKKKACTLLWSSLLCNYRGLL